MQETMETVEVVEITVMSDDGFDNIEDTPQALAKKVKAFIDDDEYWVYNGPELVSDTEIVTSDFISKNAPSIVVTNALTGG